MRIACLLPVLLWIAATVHADVSPRTSRRFFPDRAHCVRELQLPHGFDVLSQAVLSGNAKVCALTVGPDVHFHSALSGAEMAVARTPGAIHDGAFLFDGSRYATAGMDGMVRVWDTATGRQIHEMNSEGFS